MNRDVYLSCLDVDTFVMLHQEGSSIIHSQITSGNSVQLKESIKQTTEDEYEAAHFSLQIINREH